MAYGDLKDLTRKTASDKILCDKAFKVYNDLLLKMQNININVDLLQWSINFLIKKLLVVVVKMKISQTEN